jgi:hypothetical protein
MAHFAQLDQNDNVIRVAQIDDKHCINAFGEESEESGRQYLRAVHGQDTRWKQTFIDGKLRKNYAGANFKYNSLLDAFIPPKPYLSWVFNEETCSWDPPTPQPPVNDKVSYDWNEETLEWEAVEQ